MIMMLIMMFLDYFSLVIIFLLMIKGGSVVDKSTDQCLRLWKSPDQVSHCCDTVSLTECNPYLVVSHCYNLDKQDVCPLRTNAAELASRLGVRSVGPPAQYLEE